MTHSAKALLKQIVALTPMEKVKTSPPHLASANIQLEAASSPGMPVYFSVHQSDDPSVGSWVAMTYPGRNYCDPDKAVLHQIIEQLQSSPLL